MELALDIGGTRIKAAWRVAGAESLPLCILKPLDTKEVFFTGPADAAARLVARLPFASGQLASIAVSVCGPVDMATRTLLDAYNLSVHSDGGRIKSLDLCGRLAGAFHVGSEDVIMVNDAVPPLAAVVGLGAGGRSRNYVASLLPKHIAEQLDMAGAPWPSLSQHSAVLAIVLGTGVAVSFYDAALGHLVIAERWAYEQCRVGTRGGDELVGRLLEANERDRLVKEPGGRERFSKRVARSAHIMATLLRKTLNRSAVPVALLILGGGARHVDAAVFTADLRAQAGGDALYPTSAVLSDDEGQRAFMLAGTLAVHHLALGPYVRVLS